MRVLYDAMLCDPAGERAWRVAPYLGQRECLLVPAGGRRRAQLTQRQLFERQLPCRPVYAHKVLCLRRLRCLSVRRAC